MGVFDINGIHSHRLRAECNHLGIDTRGLSRTELLSELRSNGLYEIDTRFPAKPPRIDTSNRKNDMSNVFLGNGAGLHETRSNRLYVSNTDTDEPLVGGCFKDKRVEIHDVLNIRDVCLKRMDFCAETPGEEGDLRRSGPELFMYRKTGVHPGWYPIQFGSVMII